MRSIFEILHEDNCVDPDGNMEYCHIYFASVNGVLTEFPMSSTPILNFDPRMRPWYVSAGSGDKTIVLLIDISHLMKRRQRLKLAKQAILSVLDGLQSNSFIAIIAFNDELSFSCFGMYSMSDRLLTFAMPETAKTKSLFVHMVNFIMFINSYCTFHIQRRKFRASDRAKYNKIERLCAGIQSQRYRQLFPS